jgi:hypothetical protein
MMSNDQFAPSMPPQRNQQPMQPTLFQASEPIDVTLPAQEWNVVLAGLYKMPYELVTQVIDNVRRQLNGATPRNFSGLQREPREQD